MRKPTPQTHRIFKASGRPKAKLCERRGCGCKKTIHRKKKCLTQRMNKVTEEWYFCRCTGFVGGLNG